MSDYIPIGAGGGGYNYASQTPQYQPQQQQHQMKKSVYYIPQQQPSQQQFPQGSTSQQLPPGAVPVVMNAALPSGVKLVSFQQDFNASVPPQYQQQFQQAAQQQAPQQHFQQQPQQAPQQQFQQAPQQYQQQQQHQMKKSVYYPPQQQPSQQQLNKFLQGSTTQLPPDAVPFVNIIETPPGVKLVSFQQDVTASVPPQFQQQLQQLQQQAQQKSQQQQKESVYMGIPNNQFYDYHFQPQQKRQENVRTARAAGSEENIRTGLLHEDGNIGAGGALLQQAAQGQQQNAGASGSYLYVPQQSAQQQNAGAGVAYLHIPQQSAQGQQQQQESVYMGIPNNLFLASNRPYTYHFQPQQQRQETILTARENPSATNIRTARAAGSEENIRTGLLYEEGNVGASGSYLHAPQQAAQGQQRQQQQSATLQGASSDYHFDALRGLNSAY